MLKNIKDKANEAVDRLNNHHDLSIVQEYRGLHLAPMVKLKDFVMQELERLQIKYLFVSARLKMMTTILDKIKTGRHKKLSTMQDLGGARVVFDNAEDLYTYYDELLKSKAFKILRKKDYIKEPKETGYRGIHIIYDIDGYSIELQLRTEGQHIWASTVETVGWYFNQDLKSGKGFREFNEFFQKLSTIFSTKSTMISSKDIEMNVLLKEFFDKQFKILAISMSHFDEYSSHVLAVQNESIKSFPDLLNRDDKRDKENRRYCGNYFMISAENKKDKACIPNMVGSYKDAIKIHASYTSFEIYNYRNIDAKYLLIWLSDTSKLEEAYPCFFSQTKKFTDYLDNIKG